MKRISIWFFLPLIIAYYVCIILFSEEKAIGDEIRYLMYAERMAEGNYAGDPDNPDLMNGPGLPIIFLPFQFLNLDIYYHRFINPIFMWVALVFVSKTLLLFTTIKRSIIFTYAYGLYPVVFMGVCHMWPEIVSAMLIAIFMYHFLMAIKSDTPTKKHIIFSALSLGCITLVKFIFGYVLLAVFVLALLHYVITKDKRSVVSLSIPALAMIVCLPWLIFTYSITGRFFYWGTNGGAQLYWMTSSYSSAELGSWISLPNVLKGEIPITEQHKTFHLELKDASWVERDDKYREKAKENLINQPEVYLRNWLPNVGRLLFNYPNSYESQKITSLFFILGNSPYIFFTLMSLIPAVINLRKLPYALVALALFHGIYLGGSTLVTAVTRYFTLAIPFVVIWLSFVEYRMLIVKVRKLEDEVEYGPDAGMSIRREKEELTLDELPNDANGEMYKPMSSGM